MGGDLMNKLKKILACMIITLGILYLPEIHANASTVTIDEATFPDSCVRKFAQEQDVNKDGVLSDEERNIVELCIMGLVYGSCIWGRWKPFNRFYRNAEFPKNHQSSTAIGL